jgi:protein TonB
MYRTNLNSRDKSGAIAAVLAVHAGLLFVFLNLSGRMNLADPQRVLNVFDVNEVPPPPQPDVPEPAEEQQKPKEEEGAAAPENIKAQATPVVAPKPRIQLPVPVPVTPSETPNEGAAPTQGAGDRPGPGTGAGGTGTGTGSGGAGSGSGGGGEGIAATRTRLSTPPLRGRDFSAQLLDAWPRGAWVYMRFRVDAAGNIIQCITDRGTGNPAIDASICDTARRRLRYRPGIDRNGNRVADWAAYGQAPPR